MSRLVLTSCLLLAGCSAHTPAPAPSGPTSGTAFTPIKGLELRPGTDAKVPTRVRLPEKPLVGKGSFNVVDAWANPPRALLRVTDPKAEGGAAWSLVDLDSGKELFHEGGVPAHAAVGAGALILEDPDRDRAVSLATGKPLGWKARTSDGQSSDDGLRVLANPGGGPLWFLLPWQDGFLAGRSEGAPSGPVEVAHQLPWRPQALTLERDGTALGYGPDASGSAAAADCPWLAMPSLGAPGCALPDLDMPGSFLWPLSGGWWAMLPPGGKVEALQAARGQRLPLFEEEEACVDGVVFEGGLASPPRLLASCRRDEAHVELRLWSPETTWSWVEYIHPLPGTVVRVGDAPVVGFGEPAQGRLTWVDLERARRIETPRLHTPGEGRALPSSFFGLERGDMGDSLYRVDTAAGLLEMWSLILDCHGETEFAVDRGETLLECWEGELKWTEVLYADGRYLRVPGPRVAAVLPDRLVLTDRSSRGRGAAAGQLWVVPVAQQP
ncbi:MAG: hypothetical protein ABIO70_34415 [Pseudomonadota bacterium]